MANHHHINHLATAIGPLEFHAYEKGELLDLLLLVARELQLGKQTSKNVPIGLLHQELRIYGPLMEEHYAVQMDYAFSYLQEALDGGRLNSALTQKLFNLIRHREVGWESDAHEIGIIKCKVESIGADNHHIHHPGSHGVSLLQTPDNAFSDDVPNEEVMGEHVHHNHNHHHHHHHLIEEEFPVECPPISDDEKIRLLEEQTAWREELEQWEQHNNDEEVDDEDLEVEENEQAVEQDDDEQDDDDSDGDEPDYDEPDEDDEPDYDEPDYDEQDYDEPDDDEPDEDDELDDDEQQSDGQEETEQQAVVGTLHVVKQGMLEFNSSNMVITYNE
ncbi:sarcoplasmic reticulum histidine-rich calcium-binding protein-like [Scaptodrosophila lebanonensis]|uniref:Sarcoplasmic reticulum histidine-rich calcium-binding protein-like n=1 Tax=Drosophila lebanonensis TaxID=7225 RepID=A0A6J2TTB0_DROLE|nr:sarcoplasmic reticulum histidine-rich calcium-binding protein-like [Scaptodrosophila lebanonensis]